MLTGELRSKIDNVWNAFWARGIANPLEVIEQITYLLFMRGLDEAHTLPIFRRFDAVLGNWSKLLCGRSLWQRYCPI
jgi:hypothetical protein